MAVPDYLDSPPTSKHPDTVRSRANSRVLSVSKLSDSMLHDPQEMGGDSLQASSTGEKEDDDEDRKDMMYLGTSVVSLDKILNKLMFDPSCHKQERCEFETNQNILNEAKRMEP
jgi:hypothetical protein